MLEEEFFHGVLLNSQEEELLIIGSKTIVQISVLDVTLGMLNCYSQSLH